jgi:hypothetical protein
VAVGARLRGCLALGLLATVAGCGQSSSSPQRAALAAYITRVDRIESALNGPLTKVTTTGVDFMLARQGKSGSQQRAATTVPGYAAEERALRRALVRIRTLRRELAAAPAPARARHLRRMLLELVDGQAGLTHQVALLVAFLPRFDALLAELAPATQQLNAALRKRTAATRPAIAAGDAAKTRALRRFKASVDAIVRRLRTLMPPAASKPNYTTQLKSLEGMSAAAGGLASAIKTRALKRVRPLLLAYDRAATSDQSLTAQKAEIAAVRAYDAKAAAFNALQGDIQAELRRIEKALP